MAIKETVDIVNPSTTVDPPSEAVLVENQSSKKHSSDASEWQKAFAYRHYYPLYPNCNKILAMKWDENRRRQHLKKLAAAKPNVDNSAPKVYTHLQLKLKKVQMEQDRQGQIQRNNRILLEKMSHIMKMEAKDPNIHGGKEYNVPLNALSRKKQAQKIDLENRAMLQRLEDKKPFYNYRVWENERRKTLTYLQNISSYPAQFIKQQQDYDSTQGKHKKKSTTLPPIDNKGLTSK